MLHFIAFFMVLTALWSLETQAADSPKNPPPTVSFENQTAMNGISFYQFRDFWKRWRLITARYREDTGEMRFTYANEAAWETLIKGRHDYQAGSAFAKIGYKTNRDPVFASSLVPDGAKRVQFMVRDPEKYPETDGWGYALFNGQGKTLEGEPKQAALACAACHRIVNERGFVFSQPLDTDFSNPPLETIVKKKPAARTAFDEIPVKELPEVLRKLLPTESTLASSLKGELRHFAIAGTLDEIRPELVLEVKAKRRPATLLLETGKGFSAIWLEKGTCPQGKESMSGLISYPLDANHDAESILKLNHFCN